MANRASWPVRKGRGREGEREREKRHRSSEGDDDGTCSLYTSRDVTPTNRGGGGDGWRCTFPAESAQPAVPLSHLAKVAGARVTIESHTLTQFGFLDRPWGMT